MFTGKQLVKAWLIRAFNSRGGFGPWKVQDVVQGNPRFGVEPIGGDLDYWDVEGFLQEFAAAGGIDTRTVGNGMIDEFFIDGMKLKKMRESESFEDQVERIYNSKQN